MQFIFFIIFCFTYKKYFFVLPIFMYVYIFILWNIQKNCMHFHSRQFVVWFTWFSIFIIFAFTALQTRTGWIAMASKSRISVEKNVKWNKLKTATTRKKWVKNILHIFLMLFDVFLRYNRKFSFLFLKK